MKVADDLEAVIRLACLTEDRTNAEQQALLRVARKVDDERNACVTGNRRMWGLDAGSPHAIRQLDPSELEALVDVTRVVSDFPGDKQKRVALKDRVRAAGACSVCKKQHPRGDAAECSGAGCLMCGAPVTADDWRCEGGRLCWRCAGFSARHSIEVGGRGDGLTEGKDRP